MTTYTPDLLAAARAAGRSGDHHAELATRSLIRASGPDHERAQDMARAAQADWSEEHALYREALR